MKRPIKVIKSVSAPDDRNTMWLETKEGNVTPKVFVDGEWKPTKGSSDQPSGNYIEKPISIPFTICTAKKDNQLLPYCLGNDATTVEGFRDVYKNASVGDEFPLYEYLSGEPLVFNESCVTKNTVVKKSDKVFVLTSYSEGMGYFIHGTIDGEAVDYYPSSMGSSSGYYVTYATFIDDSYLSPSIMRTPSLKNVVAARITIKTETVGFVTLDADGITSVSKFNDAIQKYSYSSMPLYTIDEGSIDSYVSSSTDAEAIVSCDAVLKKTSEIFTLHYCSGSSGGFSGSGKYNGQNASITLSRFNGDNIGSWLWKVKVREYIDDQYLSSNVLKIPQTTRAGFIINNDYTVAFPTESTTWSGAKEDFVKYFSQFNEGDYVPMYTVYSGTSPTSSQSYSEEDLRYSNVVLKKSGYLKFKKITDRAFGKVELVGDGIGGSEESSYIYSCRVSNYVYVRQGAIKNYIPSDFITPIKMEHAFPQSKGQLLNLDDGTYLMTFPSYFEGEDGLNWIYGNSDLSEVLNSTPHVVNVTYAGGGFYFDIAGVGHLGFIDDELDYISVKHLIVYATLSDLTGDRASDIISALSMVTTSDIAIGLSADDGSWYCECRFTAYTSSDDTEAIHYEGISLGTYHHITLANKSFTHTSKEL